jgi:hypothetical protein
VSMLTSLFVVLATSATVSYLFVTYRTLPVNISDVSMDGNDGSSHRTAVFPREDSSSSTHSVDGDPKSPPRNASVRQRRQQA